MVRCACFCCCSSFLVVGAGIFVITVGLACFADDVDQKSNYDPKKSHTRFGLFAFVWKHSSFRNIGRARFVQTRCRGTPDEHGLSCSSSSPSLPPSALPRIDGCCLRPHAHLHMQASHRNLETWDSSVLVSIQLPCWRRLDLPEAPESQVHPLPSYLSMRCATNIDESAHWVATRGETPRLGLCVLDGRYSYHGHMSARSREV